jgi:predicted GNAT superfamily acetyltransferase
MTIAIDVLATVEDLRAAVALQGECLGERNPAIWSLAHLHHIQKSGGLVLGVRRLDAPNSRVLDGLLVDLVAEHDAYPARRTVVWEVNPKMLGRRIGTLLREAERRMLRNEGVDLACWDVDPLSSIALHVSLNKLGCIATGYGRDALGSVRDVRAPGLPTDRIRMEWWLDAPRVAGVMDQGRLLPHHQVGLHKIAVLTKSTVLRTGVRGLVHCEQDVTADHVLVEIPEDLATLQARDYEAAVQWRLQSRDVLENLFQLGYVGVGLMHEGGRSFLLLKKGSRRTELGAVGEREQRRI